MDMSDPPTGSRTVAGGPGLTNPIPHRIYLIGQICSIFIGFKKGCTPLEMDISETHRIYPTQPNLSQFESLIAHIISRSDISDVLTLSTVINMWGLEIGLHPLLTSAGHSNN
jgi:hypothetical protein